MKRGPWVSRGDESVPLAFLEADSETQRSGPEAHLEGPWGPHLCGGEEGSRRGDAQLSYRQ